ncbi:CBS domain-containing protein [Burkholderia thailandensis]|uniref:CBS domain protein n=2 Tax=Burkholderia thailandensis TaxID=57975 RepID=A0AAW9CKF0_BURTH|nr:CBS domain-containing protein [Burkholderia thailandensis]ABC35862.1 CBS domain protein [Burkholderia thailandensis E264]AHI67277.1 CBS domain protein [Burkholderia thailandensis H0587]AHI74911.1 CBS domain protein [Burkholderia thailandensis 2002721723]AHI82263.1 CBS domain protein [Burkholderia thailandensis E444]AIC90115.1 CBS domain protein [Burkholderia thailandensis USAMRU Malaysia \
MYIGRISTQPVEFCTADCNALELAERMRHAHVGDIVVIEYRDGDAVPIGLVTDRDLVVEVMARGEAPDQVTAGQVMSRGLIVVSETDEIAMALEEMRRSGIRRLPVVDDMGRLTGIVTLDDIVEYLAALFGGIAEISKLQQVEEQRFRA